METETLSCYDRSQDKHILENPINVNIPNHGDDSNSLPANELNDADASSSDGFRAPVDSSTKKDKENCDKTELNASITNHEEEEEKNLINQEVSLIDEAKRDLSNEKQNEDKLSQSLEKDENELEQKNTTMNNLSDKENLENEESVDITKHTENKTNSATDAAKNNEGCENEVHSDNENINMEPEESSVKDMTHENEKNCDNETINVIADTNDNDAVIADMNDTDTENCPLLKETLTKPKKLDDSEDKEVENENGTEEIEMDDDFDPSLLCPDIAMEVDEAPVITTTDNVPTDGDRSPLLFDPIYSTYVDEMTGAEVAFNLTPEEHQLRQDSYGDKNPIQFTRIHCTACNVHLGSALDGQSNRFVHPLLKVLICKNCYHFYTSGEFEKDEDGSELYCRWCGQGGQVLCCSSCEMVFCKKCIRINFGRRKLVEIRDSEDWYCFRCNPLQLTALRVHCAEFMEYIRRELSRAATLENAASFMTTDYSRCCVPQKKKHDDSHASEPKKRKKKFVDPDYEPEFGQEDSPKPSDIKPPVKVVPILPKSADPNLNAGVVTQNTDGRTMFKIGNTMFKPRATTLNQVRPIIQPSTAGGIRSTVSPSYIKIVPSGMRTMSPNSILRPQSSFQQRSIKTVNQMGHSMKHEWFEKTVRAAARVNSNLSYTLTQLNRAQATATSVEALAVVHNKLQEILSTSINSLIQIRKNLRTEFIAGIKNIRFPPKPPQPRPLPSTSSQDDDVIFVSPPSSPIPPPLPLTTSNNSMPPNNITTSVVLTPTSVVLTPSSVVSKQNSVPIVPTTSFQPIPSTSANTSSDSDKPKLFLRVKSLKALQNVTSECITIPDDPLPPSQPPPLAPISSGEVITVVEDSPEKKQITPVIEIVENRMEEKCESVKDVNMEINDTSGTSEVNNLRELKDFPTLRELIVYLERSAKIEELIKNKYKLVNGDTSE